MSDAGATAPPPSYSEPVAPSPSDHGGGAVRNGMGTAALVLGIIAFLLSWTVVGGILLGVLAVIFGLVGRGRDTRGEANNGGAALAGIILGAVGIVIAAIAIAFIAHHHGAIHNLNDCLNKANGNQQKVNSCNQQFSHSVTGH